jgi:hypothetical protein
MKTLLVALILLQQPALDTIDAIETLLKQLRTTLAPAPTEILLPSGADVTAAIAAGPAGMTYQLASGGSYGPITISKDRVTLRGLNGVGRAAPGAPFPVVTGLDRVVMIPAGVKGTQIIGIEVAGVGGGSDLVMSYGSDYIFDGVYVHGDPLLGQKRGITMNGDHGTVIRSHIVDIMRQGQDTQAIGSCDSDGPLTIEDNYLEGAAENVMIGGCDPTVVGRIATGIKILGNTITKPLSWKGSKWSVKNLIELKNAQDVEIADNDLSNSWAAGQGGYAIAFTVRNQDGHCPWCTVARVNAHGNRIAHVNGFVNILGRDDKFPSGVMTDVEIADNVVTDLNATDWGTVDNPSRGMLVQGGPINLHVLRNTVTSGGARQPNSFLGFDQPQWKLIGFVFSGNTMPQGGYGIASSQGFGTLALDTYAPGYAFDVNTIVKTGTPKTTIKYPATTILQ